MQVNFDRIPDEMKIYRQWLVWRYEDRNSPKPTKVPYCPLTGQLASVTDPSTWCSFDEAKAHAGHFDGIGFVLTKHDPYAFVDLDNTEGHVENTARQVRVFEEFDSYSELSPSGSGLHIICKGHTPNGRRRASMELYTNERYMTMTGNVYHDKPIMERQTLVQTLWAQMGGGASVSNYGDAPQTHTDAEIIDRGLAAANGEKFKLLLDGNWQGLYTSQSEADFAFMDILAFYTQNRDQLVRMFRASPLGQRDKAQRGNYVGYMLNKCFDRMLPLVEIENLANDYRDASGQESVKTEIEIKTSPLAQDITKVKEFHTPQEIVPPPGLMGEIAQFIYNASPRQVPEIAICAAIGLMAGICGRSYNVSGTGLNQYVLLLAPTGTGKEAIAGGISKLLTSIYGAVPASDSFRGPAEFASGQSLLKHLTKTTPCFVSVIGEFGHKMQQLASPRASSSEIMLKKVLLDLYNKSGNKDILASSIYADSDKNTLSVKSPAVSILGESTPELFYSVLDETLIADGLLPRFLIIEYRGKRPPRNENHDLVEPSARLVEALGDLCAGSLAAMGAQRVIDVGYTPEALKYLNTLDKLADDMINSTESDSLKQLWNRAHIKTLKLAALVAVGVHQTQPVITLEHAKWAYNVIATDILGIVARFSRGEIGRNTEENKQGAAVLKIFKDYLSKEYHDVMKYGVDQGLHTDRVVPFIYISRRLSSQSLFRDDRLGLSNSLKRTLQGLIDAGDIVEIGKNTMAQRYKYTGRAFMLARFEKPAATMQISGGTSPE